MQQWDILNKNLEEVTLQYLEAKTKDRSNLSDIAIGIKIANIAQQLGFIDELENEQIIEKELINTWIRTKTAPYIFSDPSLFGGSGDLLFSLSQRKYNDEIEKIKDYLLENILFNTRKILLQESLQFEQLDFLSGVGSAIYCISLLNSIDKRNLQIYWIIKSYISNLIKKIHNLNISNFGVAHGLAGILIVLRKIKDVFYFKDVRQQLDDLIDEIRGKILIYLEAPRNLYKERNSWCYGDLAIQKAVYSNEKLDITNHIETVLCGLKSDVVCHGKSSLLIFCNTDEEKSVQKLLSRISHSIDLENIIIDKSYNYDKNELLSGKGGVILSVLCEAAQSNILAKQMGMVF